MKFVRIALLCFVLLLMVVAATPAQEEPVTLRIGTTYIFDTLNPTQGFYGYGRRPLWHDTLVEYGGRDIFAPGIAESWQASEDGLIWEFQIRDGLEFSDGTPLTAEDVAWSLNWVLNTESLLTTYMGEVVSIAATSNNVLRIEMGSPVANMITAKLIFTWILPRHIWENLSEEEVLTFDGIESTIGSGPFKVVEFVESQYLILEAVENHWRGAPPVDRIIYQEYATEDALIQALLAGEIDMVEDGLPFSGISTLQDAGNIQLSLGQGFSFEELIINSSPDGTQPASLNDLTVRNAIAHAVDKQQIITIAYLGYAEPAATFLVPAMGAFFNPAIADTPYDLALANQILDEAGFVDSDNDGVREYSDGTPLFYRLYAPESETYYARILDIISLDLAEIGIGTDVQILSDEALIDLQPEYDYDLVYWGWNWDPDPDFALSVFTCGETADYGWSDSGYCNQEYDDLYALQGSLLNPGDRRAAIWQMQELIFRDKPYIPVAFLQEAGAFNTDRISLPEDFAGLAPKWWLYNGFSLNN